MRVMILAFIIAGLAGCSAPSMSDMRATGPARTFTSTKAADALSKCILFGWQDSSLAGGGMPMAIQPGREGIATIYAGNREYFADVSNAYSGSVIQYYAVSDNWVSRDLLKPLQACL